MKHTLRKTGVIALTVAPLVALLMLAFISISTTNAKVKHDVTAVAVMDSMPTAFSDYTPVEWTFDGNTFTGLYNGQLREGQTTTVYTDDNGFAVMVIGTGTAIMIYVIAIVVGSFLSAGVATYTLDKLDDIRREERYAKAQQSLQRVTASSDGLSI